MDYYELILTPIVGIMIEKIYEQMYLLNLKKKHF